MLFLVLDDRVILDEGLLNGLFSFNTFCPLLKVLSGLTYTRNFQGDHSPASGKFCHIHDSVLKATVHYKCQCIFYKNVHSDLISNKINLQMAASSL